jgi:hypothetical protein
MPNPDTHCITCGEPLSIFYHCWQHHYPPMDPAQDSTPLQLTTYNSQHAA